MSLIHLTSQDKFKISKHTRFKNTAWNLCKDTNLPKEEVREKERPVFLDSYLET